MLAESTLQWHGRARRVPTLGTGGSSSRTAPGEGRWGSWSSSRQKLSLSSPAWLTCTAEGSS